MDWIMMALIIFLLFIFGLILFTLYSLVPLGDERKKMIQQKASAYSFSVVIVFLLIEIGSMAYTNLATNRTYDGLNPFLTLIIFSILYLITLLRTKDKYSG